MNSFARHLLALSLTLCCGAAGWIGTAGAQTTGALYDPQHPADSAYVRVIVVSATGSMDVQLDGKTRLHGLAAAATSDYMVVRAGKHTLQVLAAAKSAASEINLDVVAGRSLTVAFPILAADVKPWVFEDRANTNKLKAVLTVYNLAPSAGAIDLLTADGNTKVFSAVVPGTSASQAVNPITVELQASKTGDKISLAKTSLALALGQTYSLLLLPAEGNQSDKSDKFQLKSHINTLERYTGK